MSANAQSESVPNVEQTNSTVLGTEQLTANTTNLAPIPNQLVVESDGGQYSRSDCGFSAEPLFDRWVVLGNHEWSKSHGMGTKLFSYNLPYDFIAKNPNSPTTALFKTYKYFSGDIEVKIQVNANRFMIGQLQASYYYGATLEEKFDNYRNNVYSRSQMNHVLLSAHTNNEGYLKIPYAYSKLYMPTRVNDFDNTNLKMAEVTCLVLNSLLCVSTVYSKLNLTVYVKFSNCHFAGLIDMNHGLYDHQMLPMFVRAAEAALHSVAEGNSNRDLPSRTGAFSVMQPRASASLAPGKNALYNALPMRLDPLGTTPSLPSSEDLNILKSCQKYGLISQLTWKAAYDYGYQLFTLPVGPMLRIVDYPAVKRFVDTDQLNYYQLPQLSVISSMFSLWRGSIKLRFDFISSIFHTGRVAFTFVPHYSSPRLDFEIAKNSYYAIYDLEDGDRSVEFVIPYVNDNPWMSVNKSDIAWDSFPCFTGYFRFYVINPLIPMDNVYNFVQINVYMAAGDDFELAVPISPTIGLAWENATLKIKEDSAVPKSGYELVYAGAWRNFGNSTKYIMRYGNVTDHIAQLSAAIYWAIYALPFNKSLSFVVRNANNVTEVQRITYFVVPKYDDFVGYYYMVPFAALKDARKFVASKDSKDAIDYVQDTATSVDTSKWEYKLIELDPADNQHQILTLAPGKGDIPDFSMLNLGETFDSLKDLLRRFQCYEFREIIVDSDYKYGTLVVRIPIIPQSIPLNFRSQGFINQVFNKFRHGHIPIILSRYRFFRGGLRFKLVFTGFRDTVVQIQHIPNSVFSIRTDATPNPNISLSHSGHTYSTIIQDLRVNSVVDIEVPYYLPNPFGMNQRPNLGMRGSDRYPTDIERAFQLGYLTVSFLSDFSKVAKINCQIYYSASDDFELYIDQGYPPMTFNSEVPVFDVSPIPTQVAIPLPDIDFQPHSSVVPSTSRSSSEFEHQMFTAMQIGCKATQKVEQGIGSAINTVSNLHKTAMFVDRTSRKIQKLVAQHQSNDMVAETITRFIEESFGDFNSASKQLIFSAVSQVVHCMLNPSKGTISWAIASFLISIGVLTYDTLKMMSTFFQLIFDYFDESNNPSPEVVTHEGVAEDVKSFLNIFTEAEKIKYMSVLVAGIISFLGGKSSLPKKDKNLAAYCTWFMKSIITFSLTFKGIMLLLTQLVALVRKLIDFVIGEQNPGARWLKEIQTNAEAIKAWAERAAILSEPSNKQAIENDIYLQKEVFECGASAQLILAKMSEGSYTEQPQTQATIRLLANRILNVEKNLIEENLCPSVSREPFVLQISGEAKIGKSHMQQRLGIELLKHINYTTYKDPIYCRTPGNKFMNNLNGQPIFLIDDFLYSSSSLTAEEQINELMCLKSRAVYNPPMAELSDKKIRYSPLIVLLCANQSYWKIPTLEHIDALHRRRDLLVHARKVKDYKDMDIDAIPKDVKKDCKHLEFAVLDSIKPTNAEDLADELFMNYEDFLTFLKDKWFKFYENETELFKQELANVTALYPNDTDMTLQEHLEEQKKRVEALKQKVLDDVYTSAPEWKKKYITRAHHQMRDPTATTPTYYIKDCDSFEEWAINKKIDSGVITHIKKFICSNKSIAKFVEENQALDFLIISNVILKFAKDNPKDVGMDDTYNFGFELMGGRNGLLKCPHYQLGEFHMYEPSKNAYVSACEDDADIPAEPCKEPHCALKCKLFAIFRANLEIYVHNVALDKDFTNMSPVSQTYAREADLITAPAKSWFGLPSFRLNKCKRTFKFTFPEQIPDESFYDKYIKTTYNIVVRFIKRYHMFASFLTAIAGVFFSAKQLFRKAPLATNENCSGQAENLQNGSDIFDEYGRKGTESDPTGAGAQKHQAPVSGDNVTIAGRGAKNTKFNQNLRKFRDDLHFARHESADSNDSTQSLLKAIKRNAFILRASSGSVSQSGKCLGIGGSFAIILKHQIEGIELMRGNGEHFSLEMVINETTIPLCFESLEFLSDAKSSLSIVRFDNSVPPFRTITSRFADAKSLENIATECVLVDATGMFARVESTRINTYVDLDISSNSYANSQKLSSVFKYPIGGQGRCGSVLVSVGSNPRIIGIHVAGNGSTVGFAQPVWRELYHKFINDQGSEHQIFEPNNLYDPDYETLLPNVVVRIGDIPTSFVRRAPRNSRIIPSKLHGTFPITTVQAPLREFTDSTGKVRDPFFEAIAKRSVCPTLRISESERRDIIREFSHHFIAISQPVVTHPSGVLAIGEVVIGTPGIPGLAGIELATSEGFPWVLSRPREATSKRYLFDIQEMADGTRTFNGLQHDLQEVCDYNEKRRRQGICCPTIFTDTLKDARIKRSKMEKHAPSRLFSISPVDYTLAVKQYFGLFQAALYGSRIKNCVAIGINPDSYEWGEVVRHLTANGDNVFTGDYKHYGDTLDNDAILMVCEIINAWYLFYYPGEDTKTANIVRKTLVRELSHSIYLAGKHLYRPLAGIPSGCPITTELNSIVGLIYLCVAYLRISPFSSTSIRSFFTEVRPLVYGDDIICGVSNRIRERFNGRTYSAFLAKHNIEFTDASKSGDIKVFDSIIHATFLKRGFRQHPVRSFEYLAPLPEDVVCEIINWTWSSAPDPDTALFSTGRSGLDAAYGLGREWYENYRTKLIDAFLRIGYHFHSNSWEELDVRNFEQTDTPFNTTMRCRLVAKHLDMLGVSTLSESEYSQAKQPNLLQKLIPSWMKFI